MNYEIRAMLPEDGERVLEILKDNIETTSNLTELDVPNWEAWDTKNFNVCRFILEDESNAILGWCSLRAYSEKDFYQGVADVSIYVDKAHHGKGFGSMLLRKLVMDSETHEFWTLQLNILPENQASISLFQKFGFRIVGTRKKLARVNNEFKDVLLLERRSNVIAAE